MLFVEYL